MTMHGQKHQRVSLADISWCYIVQLASRCERISVVIHEIAQCTLGGWRKPCAFSGVSLQCSHQDFTSVSWQGPLELLASINVWSWQVVKPDKFRNFLRKPFLAMI